MGRDESVTESTLSKDRFHLCLRCKCIMTHVLQSEMECKGLLLLYLIQGRSKLPVDAGV